jgi:hypothetical protein
LAARNVRSSGLMRPSLVSASWFPRQYSTWTIHSHGNPKHPAANNRFDNRSVLISRKLWIQTAAARRVRGVGGIKKEGRLCSAWSSHLLVQVVFQCGEALTVRNWRSTLKYYQVDSNQNSLKLFVQLIRLRYLRSTASRLDHELQLETLRSDDPEWNPVEV